MDVHGQHEHQSLLDAKNHMGFLDSFGDAAFQRKGRKWRRLCRSGGKAAAGTALRKENAQRNERQEYLQSRVKELDAAQLTVGESGQTFRRT